MRISVVAARVAVLTVGMWVLALPAAPGAEPQLRIDYDPPRLSVEAEETGLLEVLNAIGAKVGFTVVESRAASAKVSVSIAGASVEDALRQLLRSENHTILYREAVGVAVVDRIVLLGPPGESSGVAAAGARPTRAPMPVATDPQPPASATPTALNPATSPPRPVEDGSGGEEGVTVGDMLRSHAVAGLPVQPTAVPAAEPSAAPTPQPSGPEETLATTTRRAQQGVTSLVEGLEAATRALQQQQAVPAPVGR